MLDETECRAILNEAAELFCQLGTTENFLHVLIGVAYGKGAEAADIYGDLKIPEHSIEKG
jgi:hypothetical protein